MTQFREKPSFPPFFLKKTLFFFQYRFDIISRAARAREEDTYIHTDTQRLLLVCSLQPATRDRQRRRTLYICYGPECALYTGWKQVIKEYLMLPLSNENLKAGEKKRKENYSERAVALTKYSFS